MNAKHTLPVSAKAITFAGLTTLCISVGAAADPVGIRVDLKKVGSKCIGDIDARRRVNYRREDVLAFSFHNRCGREQKVLVCATPKGHTTHAVPWGDCKGLPKNDPAELGDDFKMPTKTASAICDVLWPHPMGTFSREKFTLEVFTADSGDLKCAKPEIEMLAKTAGRPKIVRMGPELALEVEP